MNNLEAKQYSTQIRLPKGISLDSCKYVPLSNKLYIVHLVMELYKSKNDSRMQL